MATAQETIAIYNAVLQRAPTDAELASFVANSQTAQSEATQIDLLVNSSEANDFVAPIIRLYQATFGRVPDADGLDFWTDALRTQVQNGGDTFSILTQINAGFAASSEFATRFPSASESGLVTEDFLTDLYQQTFQRDPTDADKEFYIGKTIAATLSAFAQSSETINDFGPYVDLFLNKAANGTQDNSGSLLDANDDGTVNQDDVDTVTPDQVSSFTLTTGVDNITGTSGSDNISNGVVGTTAQNATFNNGDVIDLGAGTDSFDIVVATAANWPTAASVSNVENFFIRSADAGDLSFAAVSGAEQIWSNKSSDGLQVIDIQNNVTLGLKDTTQAFSATFGADKVGGATSTLNVATMGSTATLTVDVDGADVFTKAAINSTGTKSALTLDAADDTDVALTELSVSGDASLSLIAGAGAEVEFDGLTKLDASAMTAGGLTIDLTGNATGTTKLAYTGSAGNDTVTFATADLTSSMSLNGGAGTDTLAVTGNATADSTLVSLTAGAKVSNFEVLRAEALTLDDGVDLTIDASAISGLSEVQLQAMEGTAGAPGSTANVTNLDSGDKVTFLGDQGTDLTNTLSFKATALTADTRSLTVELGDGAGVDGTKNGVTIDSLNVAKATDVTVNSVGGANTVTTQTTTDLKNLIVTGDKQVTFSAAIDGDNLASIDASGMTLSKVTDAGLTMSAASTAVATGGLTITGSSGVDAIFASEEAGSKTTINGSTGADTITLDGGNNSLDTIVYTSADQLGKTTATTDEIVNFDINNDVLKFSGIEFAGTFAVQGTQAFAGSGNASAYVDGSNDLAIDFNGDGQLDALIVGTFTGITNGNFDIA
ncbi:hypothetical protein SAMN06297251_13417 [Fulvimarina manganoxydans]|uniref:DUF4214 domain-containing protein n=1 Tax=Fulvimarina manganoxydans TaxID=937218 RepID=A0A1W2ETL6_9HYPH|nr:hypothetical protein [Fulvimarina manganoxydans]SMD13054.1 hypothetical protein SAMN06297251_13417 [Fulvimarina manganoxydans]